MDRHEDATRLQYTRKIRNLNDRLRREGLGGTIVLTRAVAGLDEPDLMDLLRLIREFDDFTQANDPWSEHDFGEVVLNGIRYFWKIDAHSRDNARASPDPTYEADTRRVLTIMTGEDL